ncbi:MAG: hypothetical protein K2N35_10270 [Muribaculaceae bacterium]|nr:hypothetical protein [Muribaculaceae bacterium]
MKKKVLYGASLALLASVSMGTLQSCKDDLSDLRQEVVYNQSDLIEKLKTLRGDLEGQIKECERNCSTERVLLKAKIDTLTADLSGKVDTTTFNTEVARLQGLITDFEGNLADNAVISGLNSSLNTLNDAFEAYKTASEAAANATSADLADLRAKLTTLSSTINSELTAINTKISELSDVYEKRFDTVTEDITNIKKDYTTISNTVNGLSDNVGKLTDDLVALGAKYETQQASITAMENGINDLWTQVFGPAGLSDQLSMVRTELLGEIDDLKAEYVKITAEHQELWEAIFAPGGISDQMHQYYQDNKAAIDELTAAHNALAEDQKNLWEEIYGEGGLTSQMSQIYNSCMAAIGDNTAAIEVVAASTQELWEGVFGEDGVVSLISQVYNACQSDINDLKSENEEIWLAMYGENGLSEQMSMFYRANQAAIQEVADDLETVSTKLNNLLDRVNDLITGILIQSTDNPIFGNFSMPLGIKSNLLFNWYGYNMDEAFQFPSADAEYNYCNVDYGTELALTRADLAALKPEYKDVNYGYLGEVDLGRLYLTVNPINHNFDMTSFNLESTDGAKLPYEVRIKKNNDKLYWGYTRADKVEDNGLYSADVVISGKTQQELSKGIEATRIHIDEGLKTAAKDLLKDRTKRNAYNMLKALYSQMSGMLPMYGVRYSWTSGDEPYAVLSNYDLAVATAKPLSYSFLYGKGTTKHLPTYGHIDNIFKDLIDKDKFKFELKTKFKIDKFEVKFTDFKFDLNVQPSTNFTDTIKVTVTVPETTAEGTLESTGEHITVTVPAQTTTANITSNDLKPLIDAINDGFQKSIKDMNDQLNGQINDQIRKNLIVELQKEVNDMLDNIQGQITEMLDDLEGQINDQMSKIIDDLMTSIQNKTGGLFNRVNDAIDVYNKVAGKINEFLEDPNHYLQVAMFYKGKGNVHVLSTNKNYPTLFKYAGGDAISLYASSYSAEILAPAYMKYIAVTGGTKADGSKVSPEDIEAINKASGLNKVYPGVTKRIGVAASKLEKNVTYEIVYQGVDYSGKTSTQKFYIKVQ